MLDLKTKLTETLTREKKYRFIYCKFYMAQ